MYMSKSNYCEYNKIWRGTKNSGALFLMPPRGYGLDHRYFQEVMDM